MKATWIHLELAEVVHLAVKLISTVALPAALLALPASVHAQDPPGSGDCTDCTSGDYCERNANGQWTCYGQATFCAEGTLQGWNYCQDHPPYGACTVDGGVCESTLAMTSLPEGIIDASPATLFASVIPCPASRRKGAVARAVEIDGRDAAFQDTGHDRAILLEWLAGF